MFLFVICIILSKFFNFYLKNIENGLNYERIRIPDELFFFFSFCVIIYSQFIRSVCQPLYSENFLRLSGEETCSNKIRRNKYNLNEKAFVLYVIFYNIMTFRILSGLTVHCLTHDVVHLVKNLLGGIVFSEIIFNALQKTYTSFQHFV